MRYLLILDQPVSNDAVDPYKLFIPGNKLEYKGKVYIGLRVLDVNEHDAYVKTKQIPTFEPHTGGFPENFTINVTSVTSKCTFYNATTNEHETTGCWVSQLNINILNTLESL